MPKNYARTTMVLSKAVVRNLEIYCASTSASHSKLVEQIISDFLRAHGYQPDKMPKIIEIKYEDGSKATL